MRKLLVFTVFILITKYLAALPHAWINEFHYDNEGTDKNEFVEVVVEDPDTWYLGDLVLYMYNGYDGVQYCLDAVSEFTPCDQCGAFRVYTWYHRGIQNDTEGMILVFRDTLIDILAYEGSFTGSNTPADGLIFPDIGINESGYGADSCSLYLTGMPGSDWAYGTATPGSLNTGQLLSDTATPVELDAFTAEYHDGTIRLQWRTASETDVSGFQLFRDQTFMTFIEAKGHSSASTEYSYLDRQVSPDATYKYTLKEIHFSGKSTPLKTIDILTSCPKDFGLGPHFPNPANPDCILPVEMFNSRRLVIDLFDLSGKKIRTLMDEDLPKGKHAIPVTLDGVASGTYVGICRTSTQEETFEIVILK